MDRRQLHLGVFTYPGGHHIGGWRHPSVAPREILGYDYYRKMAVAAERGKFDLLFVGDMLAAREKDGRVIAQGALNNIDSISITAAVSGATENLGFVATLSTTYNEPFAIAERFASLDHISGGRAGWNIVTTANDDAALNFSRKSHMEKSLRYQRAKEFVDICKQLWDGWSDDALVADAKGGTFVDRSKVQQLDHQGQFFSVRGALDLPRSPQGWPVLVQAGGSPAGLDFAAMVAELIFAAQSKREEAARFRAAVKERMPKYGRDPSTAEGAAGADADPGRDREGSAREGEDAERAAPSRGRHLDAERADGFPPLRLSAGRPAADRRHPRERPGLHAARRQPDGARRPRGPVGARVRHVGRRQPLARLGRRHARAARRSHAALAGRGRVRRLQRHAGLFPGRVRPVHRPGHPDPAAARHLQERLRGHDPARSPRACRCLAAARLADRGAAVTAASPCGSDR